MSGPSFRRRRAPPAVRRRVLGMAAVLLAVVVLLWLRSRQEAALAVVEPEVIEVAGEVPRPGVYELAAPATVHGALSAAGHDALERVVDVELSSGTRVVLRGGAVQLEPMDDRLVFDLPIDLNLASAAALDAIPGIGPARAADILAERDRGGPFADVDELARVKGIGPATVEELRPFLTATPPAQETSAPEAP